MTRRKFTSKFKTKVVMECLKERHSLCELAQKYEIHPNQISMWKRQYLDGAEGLFNGDVKAPEKRSEEEQAKLYKKIGQLQVEVFKKKAWARTEPVSQAQAGQLRARPVEYIPAV